MSEQQAVDLLDRVTATLPPPGPDLVAGAVARGRGQRRRHLAGTALATVAALALAGGATGIALGGDNGATVRVADPGPTAPTAPVSADPAPGARQFGPDPAKMGWVLGSLLDGTVTQRKAWHSEPGDRSPFQAGSVLLDGAQVTILLEHTTLPGCGEQPPGAACDSVGDGFVSTSSYEEPAPGGGHTGVFTNTATYFTADHFAVTATAYNAAAEKGSEPFLDQPVLSETQLSRLVLDPVWLEEPQ